MQSNTASLTAEASSSRRPLLHHREQCETPLIVVNADTTWLLQLPSSSSFFNILLDPWLSGPQSDVASWFSKQWHAIPPALGSIAEVDAVCKESGGRIDAVAISHEFTDHCHKETLLQLAKDVPIFATTKAAALISGWNHFDTVIEIPPFHAEGGDWRKTIEKPLPPWISISRLITGKDAFYYHSAVMITFSIDDRPAESLIYTPHGIHAASLASVSKANPPIQTLVLLHGLHDVSIDWGQQLNLGAHNGLAAQRSLNARYWIGTHDEVKKGGGVVSWFLRRKQYTLRDALEKEGGDTPLDGVFIEMANGESKLL